MKATVERNDLLAALGRSKTVIERLNSVPILANVLIQVDGATLRLRSTDMDMEIDERIAAVPSIQTEPGKTTAPARTLYDIVKETLKGVQIELETVSSGEGEERLAVRAGRSSFTLPCLPPADFPTLTADKSACRFTMPAAELARLMTPIRYAMSSEETRYYLNGAYFHVAAVHDGCVLHAVATDGHRLAHVEGGLPAGADKMPDVILPKKAVSVLHKLVARADGEVKVAVSEARSVFTLDSVTLTTRNVDGSFPDYERIIPKENGILMTADRLQLAAVVKRMAKAAGSHKPGVKWTLARGSLTVSITSPEGGEDSEEVEVGVVMAAFHIAAGAGGGACFASGS